MATNNDVIEQLNQLPSLIGAEVGKVLAQEIAKLGVAQPATVKVAPEKSTPLSKKTLAYEANVRPKAEAYFNRTGVPVNIVQYRKLNGDTKIGYFTNAKFKSYPRTENIVHVFDPVGM